MKIEAIEVIALDLKLDKPFKGGTYVVESRPTLLTRVRLANGLVGEVYGGDEFHTQKNIVDVMRGHYIPMLLGQHIENFEALWQRMFDNPVDLGNRGLHILDMHPRGILLQAISALDNAMWDARAQLYDVSLARLLGGFRSKVPVLAIGGYTAGPGEDPVAKIEAEIDEMLAVGVAGIKMKVGRNTIEEDLARVDAVRRKAGEHFVIAVDANQAWSPREAIRFCRRLETADLDVRWVEEPVAWHDQSDGLAMVNAAITTPITVGQGEITGTGCRDLITKSHVDLLNVDVTLCGGITEWKRIAAMASLMNVEMAHHEEPQIAVHLIASQRHATYVEIFVDRSRDPLLWELPTNFPVISDGLMDVPAGPGVGISLDEKVIEKYAVDF